MVEMPQFDEVWGTTKIAYSFCRTPALRDSTLPQPPSSPTCSAVEYKEPNDVALQVMT